MFRSPESRSSKTSEFPCIPPDGPARNSPLQEAKHVPFSGTSARKSYRIDRSLRTSAFLRSHSVSLKHSGCIVSQFTFPFSILYEYRNQLLCFLFSILYGYINQFPCFPFSNLYGYRNQIKTYRQEKTARVGKRFLATVTSEKVRKSYAFVDPLGFFAILEWQKKGCV